MYKRQIYLAAAKDIFTGHVAVLDSDTLVAQRTFGRLGGARYAAISPNSKWLAVHGVVGIDFFDVGTGERMYRIVAGRDAQRGRFLGGSASSDYIAYGPRGFIRRYVPDLGVELAAYRNADGATVEQVDELADRSGFLATSDRPSVTEWSFDAQIISRQYAVPLVINGLDMRMPAQIEAMAIGHDGREVLASYIDRSVRRWLVKSGDMRLVRDAAPGGDGVEHVAQVGGISVLAEKSGRLLFYTEAGGSGQPAAELAGEPLSYLGALDGTRAVAVAKSGAAALLDLSSPAAPRLQPIPALAGTCPRAVSVPGMVLCADDGGTLRVYRPSDERQLLDWPAPAGAKLAAAYLASDGSALAASYSNGDLVVRSLADGSTLARQVVTMRLTGDTLKAAAQSPLLSDEDRARIRAGATELAVKIGANSISLAPGGKRAALAMPDRTIQIADLAGGPARVIRSSQRIGELAFSHDGSLLAAIEGSDMNVYEAATGDRLVSVALRGQVGPRLRHLANGQGFATMDEKTGLIRVHPVFEDVQDLLRYLAREFPEPLTPEQRRAYFLE